MAADEASWLDAQPFLQRVCDELAVGELLHGPSFSLFESTTAIEIGDPKMDIGLHRAQETGTVEELIAAGGAPVALPPPLLLACMDRLLCLEATWHTGSMLPQTVFTSLYMLQPDRLAVNVPLHAFCLGLRSACSVFVDMAHAGSVTEDEDFFVHTFGIRMLDLPGSKPVAAALQVLATAEEQLEQRVAGDGGSKASPGSGKNSSKGSSLQQQNQQQPPSWAESAAAADDQADAGQDGVQPVPVPTIEQAAGLLARIRFRRLLLEALQSLQQYSQAGVEAARKQCQLAKAQLQLVAESASLTAPLEEAPGFVPDVNRRHMGLVPPRPVHEVAFEQAIEHWQLVLRGLAGALHSLLFVRGSWAALKTTLVDFAAKDHHAIVRSAMHLQLIKPLPPSTSAAAASTALGTPVPQNGGTSGGGAVSKLSGGGKKPAAELPPWCPGQQMVCREFGATLSSVPGPEVALFIEQAAIAIQGQAYALCLNRCRQRRRLRRQLEDWKNIFDHAFNADVSPDMQAWLAKAGWRWQGHHEGLLQEQGVAATWAEQETACCALLHLQLGFPLDLYCPYEYCQLYWYCDYLLECQHLRGHLLHSSAPAPPTKRSGGAAGGRGGKQRSGRGGGSGSGSGQLSVAEQAVAATEIELLLLEVERLMCGGMFRAAIALQQLGCIVPPGTLFNSEEQRYDQRFGCLEQLCRPNYLPYEHYRVSTDATDLPPARVLAVALSSFQRAAERAGGLLKAAPLKALMRQEQVRHLLCVQRVATQNAVACKLLAATAARSAAGAAGTAAGAAGTAGADGSQAPAFKAHFDFKAALAGSVAQFYPCVLLKS